MSREKIQAKVIELAGEQVGLPPAQITAATHFVNDLNFDSLDVVNFCMNVEDEFEVSIPDAAIDKLHTVGDVVEYLAHRIAAAPAV